MISSDKCILSDSCDDNGSDSYYCSPVCHHNQHSQNNQYLTCESECRGVNGVGYGNSNISLMGYPTKYARFYTIYANSFRWCCVVIWWPHCCWWPHSKWWLQHQIEKPHHSIGGHVHHSFWGVNKRSYSIRQSFWGVE